MKNSVKLELKFSGDDIYLNYWDNAYGNDVTTVIKNGKIFDFLDDFEMTLQGFINRVVESIAAEIENDKNNE